MADWALRKAAHISLFSVMPNKRKTVAPTQEELRRFDALADREMARFMLNCIERKIAKSHGKKLPPKYRVKVTP